MKMGMRINSPQKRAKINICFVFIQQGKRKSLPISVHRFIEELHFAEIAEN